MRRGFTDLLTAYQLIFRLRSVIRCALFSFTAHLILVERQRRIIRFLRLTREFAKRDPRPLQHCTQAAHLIVDKCIHRVEKQRTNALSQRSPFLLREELCDQRDHKAFRLAGAGAGRHDQIAPHDGTAHRLLLVCKQRAVRRKQMERYHRLRDDPLLCKRFQGAPLLIGVCHTQVGTVCDGFVLRERRPKLFIIDGVVHVKCRQQVAAVEFCDAPAAVRRSEHHVASSFPVSGIRCRITSSSCKQV